MRPDVELATRKLAMRKLADRYIGRRGEPPSLSSRRAARAQDINDDDRKQLMWCIDRLSIAIARSKNDEAKAALDFIAAILERDYNLYPERRLHGERSSGSKLNPPVSTID